MEALTFRGKHCAGRRVAKGNKMSVIPQGTDGLMGQRTQVPGHYSPRGQMHCEVRCRAGTMAMIGWSLGEEYRGCRAGTEMTGWSLGEESWACRAGTEAIGWSLGEEYQGCRAGTE